MRLKATFFVVLYFVAAVLACAQSPTLPDTPAGTSAFAYAVRPRHVHLLHRRTVGATARSDRTDIRVPAGPCHRHRHLNEIAPVERTLAGCVFDHGAVHGTGFLVLDATFASGVKLMRWMSSPVAATG